MGSRLAVADRLAVRSQEASTRTVVGTINDIDPALRRLRSAGTSKWAIIERCLGCWAWSSARTGSLSRIRIRDISGGGPRQAHPRGQPQHVIAVGTWSVLGHPGRGELDQVRLLADRVVVNGGRRFRHLEQ